jgi:hypothetical protein
MKKKIEKEENNYSHEYAPVIKAFIVLLILIALLVGVIYYQPTKKPLVEDPNTLKTNEKIVNTDTTCDGNNAKNIKNDADKVSLIYEVVDDYFFGYMAESDTDLNENGIIDDEPVIEDIGYALRLKLFNVTDNLVVEITNNIDDTVKTFRSTDVTQDGYITWFESENIFMRTYTVKVYSINCIDQLYREFTVDLPKYNYNSRSMDCAYEFTKDLEVCQPFIFSNATEATELKKFRSEIQKAYKEYQKGTTTTVQADNEEKDDNKNNNKYEEIVEKTTNIVKDNYITVGIICSAILVLVILVIIKKGRK